MSLLLARASAKVQHLAIPRASRKRFQSARDALPPSKLYSSKPRPESGKQEPQQLPKLSLDGLGATPAIKGVIYAAIGVIATVETYTYSLWIYHKLYPQPVVRPPSVTETREEG